MMRLRIARLCVVLALFVGLGGRQTSAQRADWAPREYRVPFAKVVGQQRNSASLSIRAGYHGALQLGTPASACRVDAASDHRLSAAWSPLGPCQCYPGAEWDGYAFENTPYTETSASLPSFLDGFLPAASCSAFGIPGSPFNVRFVVWASYLHSANSLHPYGSTLSPSLT